MKRIVEKLKVLRSIVRLYAVLVVDDLLHVGLYKASYFLLHYKAMLRNIAHAIGEWVVRFKNVNIAGTLSAATVPERGIFKAKISHVPNVSILGVL